jgi:hypothetical protein
MSEYLGFVKVTGTIICVKRVSVKTHGSSANFILRKNFAFLKRVCQRSE